MNYCGDSIRVVHPLFPVEGGGSTPTSPLQLYIGRMPVEKAITLNGAWHSRLPAFNYPPQKCIAFGAVHDGRYYATAIWSPPVARMLNHTGRYELRRFAIAADAPRYTASRMLRIMRLLIVRDPPVPAITRLISYQDLGIHTGTIYRAAGWEAVVTGKGGEWVRARRTSGKAQSAAPKQRWELAL